MCRRNGRGTATPETSDMTPQLRRSPFPTPFGVSTQAPFGGQIVCAPKWFFSFQAPRFTKLKRTHTPTPPYSVPHTWQNISAAAAATTSRVAIFIITLFKRTLSCFYASIASIHLLLLCHLIWFTALSIPFAERTDLLLDNVFTSLLTSKTTTGILLLFYIARSHRFSQHSKQKKKNAHRSFLI